MTGTREPALSVDSPFAHFLFFQLFKSKDYIGLKLKSDDVL